MTVSVEKWAEQVRAGDVRAVSRAITTIENHEPEAETLLRLLFPHTGQAYLTELLARPDGEEHAGRRLASYHRKNKNKLA